MIIELLHKLHPSGDIYHTDTEGPCGSLRTDTDWKGDTSRRVDTEGHTWLGQDLQFGLHFDEPRLTLAVFYTSARVWQPVTVRAGQPE